jgi:hypothetical protein
LRDFVPILIFHHAIILGLSVNPKIVLQRFGIIKKVNWTILGFYDLGQFWEFFLGHFGDYAIYRPAMDEYE